jgi:FAD:protein FMN transferase
MQATSDNIRRLRPLLGTFVEVGADGAGAAAMEVTVEAAFAAIESVHRSKRHLICTAARMDYST